MSSVTAVPLQPIQKGSVSRLWLGVVVVAAAGGLLAWAGTHSFGYATVQGKDGQSHRFAYKILKDGEGPSPARDDFALVSYKGTLTNGKVFDAPAQPQPMDLSTMIPGFSEAVSRMKKDERMLVYLPPELAYGSEAKGDVIPANSPLVFDITLHEFRTRAEIMEMQRQQQMQQMLQRQMQGGGAPGGVPGGPPVPMPPQAPQGAPAPQP